MQFDIAFSHYLNHFLWLEAYEFFKIKTNEVKLIISYYNSSQANFFINQTTNLSKIFNEQKQINDNIFKNLEIGKKIASSNIAISENFLLINNLLTQQLVNQNKTIAKNYCLEKEKQSVLLFKKRHENFKNTVKKVKEEKKKKGGGGPEKDPKDDDPLPEKNLSIMGHIFRKKDGHLIDTPENRNLLRELVKDSSNYLKRDKAFKRDWYAKITKDGKQLWAWIKNDKIRDGGLNNKVLPWNDQTGLCSPTKPLK